jgi:hypothetical protein
MIPPPAPQKNNRVLLIVLGVIAALVLCCCGGTSLLGYFGFQKGSESDREAKAFATKAWKEIGRSWAQDDLVRYGSPHAKKVFGEEKMARVLATLRTKLGPLKTLDEFTTQGIHFGSQNGLPPATRVKLNASATFEKGDGTVTLSVAKIGEEWGFENFNVQSDELLERVKAP